MRCWAFPGCRSTTRRGSGPRRRRGRTCRGWTWRWCRCWCAATALAWRLDLNHHWRASLEEAYCSIATLRRGVSIEPEIIQRPPANRVSILIGRKSFRAPGDGACVLCNTPWCAAISRVSLGAIVCPTGMLSRGVETNVTYIDSGGQWHTEGLNRAVEVHVKERILIVPDSRRRVSYLVAHKPHPVVTRIGLRPVDCCAGSCPGLDSRLRSDRATQRRKGEKRRAAAN